MAQDGSKAVVVVLGLLGLGALIYFLTRDNNTQPVPYVAPETVWKPVPRLAPEDSIENNITPQTKEPKVLYQNEERITLVRDETGHISEFVVHRRVTADG